MKYIKQIFIFISVILVFGLSGIFSVSADAKYIIDKDDSISEQDEQAIDEKIAEYSKKLNLNICVITVNEYVGDQQTFADNSYDSMFGKGTDGILLLIDNYENWDCISTSGCAIKQYQRKIDAIFEDITPYLKNEDYTGAIYRFLALTEKYRYSGTKFVFLIGAAASLAVTLIVCMFIIRSYKKHAVYSPRNYAADDEIDMKVKSDKFIREYTTKVKIETSSSGSRSSGHGGGVHHR